MPNPDGTPFFGSPTKLFEYMAMAKPIVASDLDQSRLGAEGLAARRELRPPRAPPGARARPSSSRPAASTRSWPESATPSTSRAAERERLGAEARRLVLESFTWDRNVAAVLDGCEPVMQPQPSRAGGGV